MNQLRYVKKYTQYFFLEYKAIFITIHPAMKKIINIFILLYVCTFIPNAFAVNSHFESIDPLLVARHTDSYMDVFHTITNSTNYTVEVYMKWYKIHSYDITLARPFYLKDTVPPYSCMAIRHIYYDYNRSTCNGYKSDEHCVKWRYFDNPVVLFNSDLVILINDSEQDAFDRVLDGGVLGNYEVIGDKESTLGFFDNFDLIEHDDISKSSEQCKAFQPSDAFYAEGDTFLHEMIKTRQTTNAVALMAGQWSCRSEFKE